MMRFIRLCTGLLCRGDDVLLVRCAYPGEPDPLWTLPGGRHEEGETIAQAVVREFREETGLAIEPRALAYVSESIDGAHDLHVVNFTFHVGEADASKRPAASDPKVIDARFVCLADALDLLDADVLRIPVQAALSGQPHPTFFSFDAAKVRVPFFGRGDAMRGA